MIYRHPNRCKTKPDLGSSRSRVLPVSGEGPGGCTGQGGLHRALALLVSLIQLSISKGADASPPVFLQLLKSHHTGCCDDMDLKHGLNVETCLYCPQAVLSLDFQCRDDVSALK